MNVDEMTDEKLDEILFMRCKEYDDKVRADLMDRMTHMSDNPKALLKHFAHLVEVFNNQVWLIHIYREFISAINKEIDAQCNAAKSQGAKLDAGNLTKVMDEFNKQLNEARDLCKRCEPDSFMKMGIFKITDVKTNEQPDMPVFKTPRDLPKKPDFNNDLDKIRSYILMRFPWLMNGPEQVKFYYVGVNDAKMKVFRAETKSGKYVDFMYNQCQEVQWLKEQLTWPFPEDHADVEREMYMTLFDLTDTDISKPKIANHYNSPHCKDCRFCRLSKEFPNPDTARPGDPDHYYQSIDPACVGCEHWGEYMKELARDA